MGVFIPVLKDRVTLAFYNAEENYRTDQDRDIQIASNRKKEDGACKDSAIIFGEFPGRHNEEHLRPSKVDEIYCLVGMIRDKMQIISTCSNTVLTFLCQMLEQTKERKSTKLQIG